MFSWHLKFNISKIQFLTSDFILKIILQTQQSSLFQLRSATNNMESSFIPLFLLYSCVNLQLIPLVSIQNIPGLTTFHPLFLFPKNHRLSPRLVQWVPDWSLWFYPCPNFYPLQSLFYPAASVIPLNMSHLCFSFVQPLPPWLPNLLSLKAKS